MTARPFIFYFVLAAAPVFADSAANFSGQWVTDSPETDNADTPANPDPSQGRSGMAACRTRTMALEIRSEQADGTAREIRHEFNRDDGSAASVQTLP